MKKAKWFSYLIVVIIYSITFGCSSSSPTGHLSVLLTDWPILDKEVTAVNIFITKVEVRQVSEEPDENDEAEWIVFPDINQEFNLLDLQNGITVSLGDAYIPVGTYKELRLHVSEENTIELEDDATKYPLNIPSGISSGVKIKHTFTISESDLLTITLDFDAQQSVKAVGSSSNAEYQLHPVIKVKE